MKSKRGQFYLVAAVVIIALVVGFVTISNYSKRKSSLKLYDLGDELGIESQNVLDHGTYNNLNETEMNTLLEQFIKDYVNYTGKDKNLYFLFGNSDNIQIKAYEELTEVSIDDQVTTEEGKVIIVIEDIEYQFSLVEGENFYFVVSQQVGGERYVVTG